MTRKTIFLETAFWDEFSECTHDLNPFAEGNDPVAVIDKIDCWNSIFSLFCRSSVFVDTSLQYLAQKAVDDPISRRLLKKNGDGYYDLQESVDPFPNLDSDCEFECEGDNSAIYFTKIDHRQGARNHGVINICSNSIWEQHNKFIDSGKSVSRDSEWTWRTMDILQENSNGIVLFDNYILKPSINRRTKRESCEISYNLKELFRLMLPNACVEPFQISIFYYDDASDIIITNQRKELYYESISNFIRQQKPHLAFELELFPSYTDEVHNRKDFHDRVILTNNIWVSSEAGFDLLRYDTTSRTNSSAIKSTKTHGLYLGFGNENAGWLEGAYDDLIKEANECLNRYDYISNNRLLQ